MVSCYLLRFFTGLFVFCCFYQLLGQTSYMKEIEVPFSSYYIFPSPFLEANDEDGSLSCAFTYFNASGSYVVLLKISESGDLLFSKSIEAGGNSWDYSTLNYYAKSMENNLFIFGNYSEIYDNAVFLVLFDEEQGEIWGKKLYDADLIGGLTAANLNSDQYLITTYSAGFSPPSLWSGAPLGLAAFDIQTQAVLWNSYYIKDGDVQMSLVINCSYFQGGEISVFLSSWPNVVLLKLSASGDVIHSTSILLSDESQSTAEYYDQKIDELGYVYLTLVEGPEKNGVITKLDSNYEIQWSKRILGENLPCKKLKVQPLPDGSLLFVYVSYGDLPIVYGKLGPDGNLLWYKGYSFYDPAFDIGEDGSLYFFSTKKYHEDGSSESALILAKTDSLGNIEGCSQYPACVYVEDIELIALPVEWERFDGPSIPSIEVEVSDLPHALTPYCGSPAPPHPYFYLPDTICAGDCLTPDSTYNRLAHQVEWYITGPGGLDTTIIDTTFTWCFDQPGHYQVEQGIWLLGCSDYYLRDVVVLPDDLAPALGEDRVLCEQPPYSLSANASRPLRSYLWSDGSTAAELEVTSSGTYWLEASDGYCILRDTVELIFLEDLLSQGPALSLPADTAVCEQHLPYELLPQSPYTEDFSVLTISNSSASSFELWQAGSYEVQAEVYGCPVRDSFALEVNDCRSRIYFPTAFSPNGDGLNDLFLPQGKDYQGIELQIYDRWGGLLFSSEAPPFTWDGGDVSGGVYVYRFRYWNSLALQEEEISGQVVLLR